MRYENLRYLFNKFFLYVVLKDFCGIQSSLRLLSSETLDDRCFFSDKSKTGSIMEKFLDSRSSISVASEQRYIHARDFGNVINWRWPIVIIAETCALISYTQTHASSHLHKFFFFFWLLFFFFLCSFFFLPLFSGCCCCCFIT